MRLAAADAHQVLHIRVARRGAVDPVGLGALADDAASATSALIVATTAPVGVKGTAAGQICRRHPDRPTRPAARIPANPAASWIGIRFPENTSIASFIYPLS